MRLRVKLLLIYGAVILGGTAAALFVLGDVAGEALRRSAERRLQQSTGLLAEQGEKHVGSELARLESWAAMPVVVRTALDEGNPERAEAFTGYFRGVVKRERRYSIYMFDRRGECVASDDLRRIHDPYGREVISKQPGVLEAFAGKRSIGKTVFSRTTARPVVPISAPVWHEGKAVAVLRTSVDMGLLKEHLFDSVRIGGKGRVYVDYPELDKTLPEGHRLLTPDLYPRWTPPPEPVLQAMKNAPGGVYYYDGKEGRQVLASARMKNPPWMVVVTQPVEEVLAPVRMLRKALLWVALLLFVLLAGATLVLVAPVVRGIEQCRAFAARIGEGRLSERLDSHAADEVGDLANDLNAMAAGLEQSCNDLAEAEAGYRSFYEDAVEGIFQTSAEGVMLAANPALARIAGFDTSDEMLGMNVKSLYVDEHRRERFIEQLRRDGHVEHFEFDLRRKDGKIRRCALSARRIQDDSGDGGFVMQGYLVDITERHKAETAAAQLRKTERLLGEAELRMLRFQLNPHFLFNALNSVTALVEDEPEKARDMIALLADFCRATLLVPDDGMASVESETALLNQYLSIERMRWSDSLKVEISVEEGLGKRHIPVFTLQPLAENAIKYGQLSGSDPLRLRIRIAGRDGGLLVEVANTGKWFDAAERPGGTAGVGLANLKSRLEHACGAGTTLETESADGWVIVKVFVP